MAPKSTPIESLGRHGPLGHKRPEAQSVRIPVASELNNMEKMLENPKKDGGWLMILHIFGTVKP